MSNKFGNFYEKLVNGIKSATDEEKKQYLEQAAKEIQRADDDPNVRGEEMQRIMEKLKAGYPGDKKEFDTAIEHPFMRKILDKRIIQMEMQLNMTKMMRQMLDIFDK